jgi:hypothetical protein
MIHIWLQTFVHLFFSVRPAALLAPRTFTILLEVLAQHSLKKRENLFKGLNDKNVRWNNFYEQCAFPKKITTNSACKGDSLADALQVHVFRITSGSPL